MPKVLEDEALLFAHKPSGVATHRPDDRQQGFVEWCSGHFNSELRVVHRLDKETSGVLVFAKTKSVAADLTSLFSHRSVRKEYWLLSPKKSRFEHFAVAEKEAKGIQVLEFPWPEGAIGFETFTEFQRVSALGSYYLYKAFPKTGKTHQIRKHAVHGGFPILGDDLYGGESFPRLMLHAYRLQFVLGENNYDVRAEPSALFSKPDLVRDSQKSLWISSVERRKILWPDKYSSDQSLRLMHTESAPLRCDKVGDHWVLGWWDKLGPTEPEQNKIQSLMDDLGIRKWFFQWRPGSESSHSAEVLLKGPDFLHKNWVFKENELQFWARPGLGQNFGLFLDQRDRRHWVYKNSKDLSVLNLFSFTCGFSLAAAAGGALQVVSVDVFKKYLEWGKDNFNLNGLDPDAGAYEFRSMDSQSYLDWALKKEKRFDIIICDPPSFSRLKKTKKNFSVERDFRSIVQKCGDLLKPGGWLLFSTNYEKWSFEKWQMELSAVARAHPMELSGASPSQWDYEWQNPSANLKAFFLRKA